MRKFPKKLKNIFALLLFSTLLFSQFPSHVFATDLTTSLVSYWKLDEASGTRADSVGANNLSENGTGGVGQAAGVLGNAASFTSANSQYLSINDNAALSTGDIDFSISAWVYLTDKTAVRDIVTKYNNYSTSNREYLVQYDNGNDRFLFAVSSNGSGATTLKADNLGSPSINTWYFIVAWHDSVNNTINIQVNDGAVNSSAYSSGVLDGNSPFIIGALPAGSRYMQGRIDDIGFWKRVLTAGERTSLYNSGSGLEYPFGVGTPLTAIGDITGTAEIGQTLTAGALTPEGATATYQWTNSATSGGVYSNIAGAISNTYIVQASDAGKYIKVQATGSGSYTGTVTSNPTSQVPAPNAITITNPVQYRVFQRNGSNQGNISISGTYTGTPTAIEASWNGGAYATIVASPNGGTYTGTLSNQTAGQGTLTVRFTNDTGTNASVTYVGIGDIFAIAGQSNADGYGLNLHSYSNPTQKASMVDNTNTWHELADPTSQASGAKGSVWPALATLFMADQNVPIAFIPTSLSGTRIAQWARNGSNPGDLSTLYGQMYTRINNVGNIKAVLWWQGESEAADNQTYSYDITNYRTLVNNIYSDFGVKTVMAQIGDRSTTNPVSALDNVRLAQRDLWDENGNALPGPSLYDVTLTVDGVHFKTDAEQQLAANRWWASVKQDFYAGTSGRGPRLSSAQYSGDKTKIYLTFTSNDLPLLPASGYSGFTAKDGGVAATISSITKIATNQLRINLTSPAAGAITVSLGAGRTGTGATVPTDSSTYNLPAEIFVDQATTLLTHTITASAGANGSIPPSGATSVNDGSDQSYTITPDANYHVTDVLVDSVSVGAVSSYTFNTVTTDHTISATFTIDTKTLTYTAGAHGSITGTSPQTKNYGSDGSAVTAVADSGYEFVNWSDASTSNPRTDTNVIANISVTANFQAVAVPSIGAGGNWAWAASFITPWSLQADNAQKEPSKSEKTTENAKIAKLIPKIETPSETQTQIAELVAKIESLKKQIAQLIALKEEVLFTKSLQYSSTGEEVKLLQDKLKQLGFFPNEIQSNGRFGPTTLKAVQDFQLKNKITNPGIYGYGMVGPLTRAALNAQ